MNILTLLNLWSWHHRQSRKAASALKYEKNATKIDGLKRNHTRHAKIADRVADLIVQTIGD